MVEQPIPWWQRELNARLARRALRRQALRRLILHVLGVAAVLVLAVLLLVLMARSSRSQAARAPRPGQIGASGGTTPTSPRTSSGSLAQLMSGGAALTLMPPAADPATGPAGSPLRVTLTTRSGAPLPGVTVWLTVSGPVPYSGAATTDANGVAAFSFRPIAPYTVRVRATAGGAQVASSTIRVAAGPPAIATGAVLGRFYASDNRCTFDTPVGTPPLFRERFATVNFGGRPFTGYGAAMGIPSLIAKSGTKVAGMGTLNHFNAVFTGNLTARHAGRTTLTFLIDDAFDFGIGGASRVSGALSNPPRSGLTAVDRLPVVGAFNQGHLEATTQVTVRFPHPGAFPFEIDYAECMAGQEALRITTGGQFLPSR